MRHFPRTFTIVDTETTGMRPPFSRVIDLGIIRVEDGKEVERFETLLQPGVALPPSIERITGLTDEDLVHAPAFEDVALRVQELFADSVFVAHNAPFDYAFIKSEFERLGIAFSAPTFCSVQFSRALMPKARSHSLDALIERYELPRRVRHRALPDAEAVWDFFQGASKVHGEDEIERAVVRASGALRATRVARDTFTDLPDQSGVYFFYGSNQELLYIGKSKHVRTRARSHFHARGGLKEERLQEETTSVSSVSTSGELSALILESALIKKESPLYNRALRKRKTLVIAQEHMHAHGYPTVMLSRTADLSPETPVLSVFRTLTQGKEVLRRLAKEHALCPKLLGIEAGTGSCFSYQLGTCGGACVGKEDIEAYGERFREAFTKRKMRAWPYRGPVLITEVESADTGTVFFIDNWVLRGAFRYNGETNEPLIEGIDSNAYFDYDTYKILARFMLNPKNKRAIQVLASNAFTRQLARCAGAFSEEEYADRVII